MISRGPSFLVGEGGLQLVDGIAAVDYHVAQPAPSGADRFQDVRRSVTVLDVGGVNAGADDQTEGVGHDVALAALDLLVGVVAKDPSALSGLHALAVNDAGRRRRLAPRQLLGFRLGNLRFRRTSQPDRIPIH